MRETQNDVFIIEYPYCVLIVKGIKYLEMYLKSGVSL